MSALPPPPRFASSRLSPSGSLLLASLVFGLFFGAGNLIFPVEMGRSAGSATPAATVGFVVTAVGLPVVGLIASAVAGSRSVADLVAPVGRWYAVAFTTVLYLTIGPLFAAPRTATVSYEVGLAPVVGDRPWALPVFTAVFFAATAAAALRPGRLMDWVGRYLTPLFLVLLAGVLGAAVVAPMADGPLPAPTGPHAGHPFTQGLLDGYATMDALGSLAFAIVVLDAMRREGVQGTRATVRELARAGAVAVVAMSVIYAALAYVGATSTGVTPDAANGGAVLAAVSRHYYGGPGQVLVAAIVIVACLKTAIGLVGSCAQMFTELLPGRLSHRTWVLVFTGVSFVVANAGLAAIVAWCVPVLLFCYPLAMVAIALGLAHRYVGHRPLVHRAVTAFVGVAALADLLRALPVTLPGAGAVVAAGDLLPGAAQGFGWVLPGAVGLVVGLVLDAARRRGLDAS